MQFGRLLVAVLVVAGGHFSENKGSGEFHVFNTAWARTPSPGEKALKLIERASKTDDAEKFTDDINDALTLVNGTPYHEILKALINLLRIHIRHVEHLIANSAIEDTDTVFVVALFKSLSEYAPKAYFEEINELKTEFLMLLDHADVLENSKLEAIESWVRKIESNSLTPKYLPKPVEETRRDVARGIEAELERLRRFLEARVIGQPEVIDKLLQMRKKDLIYGHRTEVESLWIMGLPGTGKDSAAKAFIDGIHGIPGASETHLYVINPIKDEQGLSKHIGSATGYIGSSNFPPLTQFLVDHSCGRYEVEEVKDGTHTAYKVVENKNWRSDTKPLDVFCPEDGAIYLKNFHQWGKGFKDELMKGFLDNNGFYEIRNPNGGLSRIYVPVTIIAESNDGIHLLASRERNGQRFGQPLTAAQSNEKYDTIANDPQILKDAVMAGNGEGNSRPDGRSPGTSEELLDSFKHLVLTRALYPSDVRKIVRMQVDDIIDRLRSEGRGLKGLKIEYTDELIRFVQGFHYIEENNARQVKRNIEDLFEEPLFEAVVKGYLHEASSVVIDAKKRDDGTYNLEVKVDGVVVDGDPKTNEIISIPIKATASERERQPMSDEKLQELMTLADRMKTGVIGQDYVLEQIARAVLISEEGRQGIRTVADAKEAARAFMLLGWTSTGKTETAKVLAEHLLGSREALHVMAFTPATNEHDMRVKFTGVHDSAGNCIPSEFMKVYDRNNGRFVIVLDEIANVRDKAILNMLYDIFREPVVTTFCDGKERAMANVTILITGNAGQELLADLPQELPDVVRRAAMKEAQELLNRDPDLRRQLYEDYFSPALLARIGDQNIFNYSPLGYLSAANLFQLKIVAALEALKVKDGRRGWNVKFRDEGTYRTIIDVFEREAFEVREQGASVDAFVKKEFSDGIREVLLRNLVSGNADVIIDFKEVVDEEMPGSGVKNSFVLLSLETDKGSFEVKLRGRQKQHVPNRIAESFLLTAFHEAGHAIVTKTLIDDFRVPDYVKILPGVTRIANNWVYYAGVAVDLPKVSGPFSRERVVREIAQLMGGMVGEELIVQGGMTTSGKSNDIMRATTIAENAILLFGMSDEWGYRSTDRDLLSDDDRALLSRLTKELLDEGKALAREAIIANAQTFIAMGNELATKGILQRDDLNRIFADMNTLTEDDPDYENAFRRNEQLFAQSQNSARRTLRIKFLPSLNIIGFDKVFDLEGALETERAEELKKLTVSTSIPFAGKGGPKPPRGPSKKNNGSAEPKVEGDGCVSKLKSKAKSRR